MEKDSLSSWVLSVVGACVAVVLAAFSFAIQVDESGVARLLPQSEAAVLGLFVSVALFARLVRKRPRFSWIQLLLAVLFSLSCVLGKLLDATQGLSLVGIEFTLETNDTFLISGAFVSLAIVVLEAIGYALFFYAAIDWFYALLNDVLARGSAQDEERSGGVRWVDRLLSSRRFSLWTFAIVFVGWLPYVLYFFPGVITGDTSHQMAQFFGNSSFELDNYFPYFTTLVYGGLFEVGCLLDPSGTVGTLLMCLLQVVVGAFAAATTVVMLRRAHVPNWLVVGSLAFFALFPLIPAHIVAVEKDSLHSMLVLLFVTQLTAFCLERTRPEGDFPSWFISSPLAIAVVALLVSLTRNNGIILVVPALILACAFYRSKALLLFGSASIACFLVWQLAVLPACGVKPGEAGEALSVPAQVVAANLAADTELSPDEMTVLSESFSAPLNNIAEDYTPEISDPVKEFLVFEDAGALQRFLSVTGSLVLREPTVSLGAALETTYGAWYPFTRGTYWPEDAPYAADPEDGFTELGTWYPSVEDFQAQRQRTNAGKTLLYLWHQIPGVSLLYAPGVYAWLIALLAGFALKNRSCRKMVATFLAPFVMLELVMLAAPCASLRYALPMVWSLPLFVFAAYRVVSRRRLTVRQGDAL